jgi:hypothetical protein
MTGKVRLQRTARGKRPKYFADPAVDKLLAITVALVGEVSVLRDRLDALERVIERKGLVARELIDSFEPTAAEALEREARRSAYVERVFQVIQYERESREQGLEGRPVEEIIADFAGGKF